MSNKQKVLSKGAGSKKEAVKSSDTKSSDKSEKPDKSDKSDKADKADKTEKPDENKKTKQTKKAGLNLNVNSFKTWLKSYYTHNEMYTPYQKPKPDPAKNAESDGTGTSTTKDSDKGDKSGGGESTGNSEGKEHEDHVPNFTGAHIALAAATEVLCKMILNETIGQLSKEPSGLYKVSRAAMKYTLLLNEDLKHLFLRSLHKFDQKFMYQDLFCIPYKDMMKYVDASFGKIIMLDYKSYNLLAFLLNSFLTEMASHIYNMMLYAGKRSLDFNVVKYAATNMCSGHLYHSVTLKIDDVRKLCQAPGESDEEETTTGTTSPTAEAAKKPGAKKNNTTKTTEPESKKPANKTGKAGQTASSNTTSRQSTTTVESDEEVDDDGGDDDGDRGDENENDNSDGDGDNEKKKDADRKGTPNSRKNRY